VKSIDIEIKMFLAILFFFKKKKQKQIDESLFLLFRKAGRIEGSTSSQINSD
jgi:hypothetical protein